MAFTTQAGSGATDATTYTGTSGVDTILIQNENNYTLGARAANDTVQFQSFTQLISGATMKGGQGNDTITALNNTNLNGGFINGNKDADPITVLNTTSSTIFGGQGADVMIGTLLTSSKINGNKDADTLTIATANNSSVYGGQGADILGLTTVTSSVAQGDLDNDTINLNGAVNAGTINGNGGTDSINVLAGVATFALSTVFGGAGNDTITAGAAATGITISGDLGNDSITGSIQGDTILLGGGTDSVEAGVGSDTITAGAQQDTISQALAVNAADNLIDADTINGFTVGAGGDIAGGFVIANLELQAAITDLVSGNAATVNAGAVATAQIDIATANALVGAAGANLIIQTGNVADAATLQGNIRAGGATGSAFQAGDGFLVIYDNGTNSTLAQVTTAAARAATLALNQAVVADIATFAGVTDATTFVNANFAAFA